MPRTYPRSWIACATVALWLLAAPALASGGPSPVVHLQTMHEGRAMEGTGVVVAVDRQAGVAFVLTAAPLVRRADGEPAREAVGVALGGVTVAVPPDQVFRSAGEMTGLALLRVAVRDPDLLRSVEVLTLDYREPALGEVFVLAVALKGGQRVDVPQRTQFGATRLVVGDRSLAHLPACLGAAALSPDGVFGVVVECTQGRALVVALTSTARRFLMRHLPPVAQLTGGTPQPNFSVGERLFTGPQLSVPCDATQTGEVDVPYALAYNERAVDATASLLNASSLKVGDVTVLDLGDRVVRVRFTLVGEPPPRYALPENCARGQALVSLRVNVVTIPMR